jgi:hypothetical protein
MRGLLVFLTLFAVAGASARGDEIVLRGNYWRDRNTRVIAPEAEFNKELPSGTIVGGSYLLDAITSASVAAGVLSDQPFTELRSQISVHLGQRMGPVTLTGNYRYSTESDYWAHVGGGTIAIDLLDKNLSLAASLVYSHADVGRRTGATGFVPVGHLNSIFGILSGTAILSRYSLLDLSLEYSKAGDSDDHGSLQSNPYRTVNVGGSPMVEAEPFQRDRLTLTGGLRFALPVHEGILRHLSFYAKYRFYHDDWGITAHAPELRTYLRLGPVELRLTGRYYHQSAADFWPRDSAGNPMITPMYVFTAMQVTNQALDAASCNCFTGDAKLSEFNSYFTELRITINLSFLDGHNLPLGQFFGASLLSLSYGHYINDRFAHIQYGDSEVAGIEWIFPL